MYLDKPVKTSLIGRRLLDVYERISQESNPVRQGIPIAFPVLDSTFEIEEMIPEPIGLIRRALLRGILEFGPCTANDLDDLTGLGSDIVESTLDELAVSVPDLTNDEGRYQAGPGSALILNEEKYRRRVENKMRFSVNGLTDKLLPIWFWEKHEHQACRLVPNPTNTRKPMQTATGYSTNITVKIMDHGATGSEDIQRLISEGSVEERELYGIPTAAVQNSAHPLDQRLTWVMAYLFVHEDNSVQVQTASHNPETLLGIAERPKSYFRNVCQGFFAKQALNDNHSFEPSENWKQRWPDETKFDAGNSVNDLVICIPDSDNLHSFNQNDENSDPFEKVKFILERGLAWDADSSNIYRIRPGDLVTAKTIALIRGVRDLRNKLRPLEYSSSEPAPFDLSEWWKCWLSKANIEPTDQDQLEVSTEELLAKADATNDNDFIEKLGWFQEEEGVG